MRGVAIYLSLFGLVVLLFLFAPQIDLATSRLFYVAGRGFVLEDWPPAVVLYRAVPWMTWGILAVAAGAAAWLFLMRCPLWRLDGKALIFVMASLALGPGLLANTVLKDHWGRARPSQIDVFGGPHQFTPAPLIAAECPRNCSFVSGHAALGFSLVAFAFLLPPGLARRGVAMAALAVGVLVGLGRIGQGAHYLSDVVYAGLLVYGIAALLHWAIVGRDVLGAPVFLGLGVELKRGAGAGWKAARNLLEAPAARIAVGTVITTAFILISISFFDRPLALFFHVRDPDFRALFDFTGRLGLAYGYLSVFGVAFIALHWGGSIPRLERYGQPMRTLSAIPAFLAISMAASGIVVDILKIILGRTRPKLLFGSSSAYDFGGLGWQADHWSFPSGHTATFVALMTALWILWPRHVLFYLFAAAIVSLSRVAVGAHYLSDVLAGALIAVLTTRGVALVFAKAGFDLTALQPGARFSGEALPWPCRRFWSNTARCGAVGLAGCRADCLRRA